MRYLWLHQQIHRRNLLLGAASLAEERKAQGRKEKGRARNLTRK